ncbi:putative Ig domain-containing protein [Rhodoferax sp. TH121]|uniref:putative Ig domain-containing protein n=1 Tax=Rhodoferax sp. TH121 TaxID=2022803 RepID=UPI00159527F5|nr:putative Ig domain-containing protein [Rhodoferax sp. TH121]
MATNIELALMAGAAYESTRNEKNRLPTPVDWASLKHETQDSGFEAVAFVGEGSTLKTSSEIIISFAGTDPYHANLLSDPDGKTNTALANGKWSEQLLQAAQYYLDVRAANPTATITLTGHSLGGGLAALIAVFFDVPSTTFDQAPFAQSALDWPNGDNATILKKLLPATSGVGDGAAAYAAAMAKLSQYLQLRLASTGQVESIPRAENITTLRVEGEFLDGGLATYKPIGVAPELVKQTLWDHGPGGTSLDLHSQALLTAFLQSQKSATANGAPTQTLNEVSKKLTGLLELIFKDKLFAAETDPLSTTENFLDRLVRHEAGVQGSFAADAMVTRFTADLWKLAKEGGLTLNDNGVQNSSHNKLSKTLMAFAMQFYYEGSSNAVDSNKTLFSNVTGGVRFDMADVSKDAKIAIVANKKIDLQKIENGKYQIAGYKYFSDYLKQSTFTDTERQLIQSMLPHMRDWYVQAGSNGLTAADDLNRGAFMLGAKGTDTLTGGAAADLLVGNQGADILQGGAGNDMLMGGSDADTYQFSGTWGKDTLIDSDGLGQLQLAGITLSGGKGAGVANTWKQTLANADVITYRVVDNQLSATGKQLLITKEGDSANSITINHFDLAQATSTAPGSTGYLGIKLNPDKKIAVKESTSSNVWSDSSFTLDSLAGQASSLIEGTAKTFTFYLNQPGKAGETITLELSAQADKFKAILGDSVVDANGAVITLAEGQAQVSIALVQQGEITADASLQLSATYAGAQGTVTSNAWEIQLKDAGEVVKTFRGDQHGAINTTHSTSAYYDWSGTSWAADGTLVNGVEEAGYGDVILGSAGNDKMLGLGGNDALEGLAGNDQIDGGDGNDLIAGGMGADNIKGGAGDDTIFSDAYFRNWDGTALRQHTYVQPVGTPDEWQRPQQWNGQWSLPAGATVFADGGTWGTYELNGVRGTSVYYDVGLDVASDVVDAGDGRDYVRTGAGDDRIQGGAGDDLLYAAAGSDVVEGGTGDDKLYGDEAGVSEDKHGNDFLDGGEGSDLLIGGGRDDVLYGGSGADTLTGDGTVDVQYSGNDYLDGEDGNDQLEGGAKDDILYGGAGDDTLRGDAWYDPQNDGADYLDGEDGKDTLIGGGKDDTLYGGAGDDALYGDGTTDDAHYSGADYLDGEAGNDTLVGGGKDDTLFGGAGDDALYGDNSTNMLAGASHGNDYLDGEDGDDLIQGDGGNDSIYGGDGNDTLWGDALATRVGGQFHGADSIDGGDGNDDITGDGGADTLLGGAGDDRITGDSSLRNSNDVGYLEAQYHGDDFIDGGAGNDSLWGDGGNDTIYGGAGNDTLYGDAGSDYLDGGEGDDTLVAGAGDTVVDEKGTNTLKLADGAAERVHAEGADLLFDYGASGVLRVVNALTGSVASIDGLAMEEWLKGNLLDEVELTTTRAHQRLAGGSGNDRLTANHENATLLGGEGADTLVGSFGDDQLHGGAGNDVVDGGAGNDVLFADEGRDVLRGGAGLDTYVLGRSTGRATVQDDSSEGSVIRLDDSGLGFDNLQASRLQNDLLVSVRGTATSMRIEGYFNQSQPNYLITDNAQNTMTVDALLASSKPSWDGLISGLRQDYKLYARSVVGASAYAQGMTLQADGSWKWTSSYKGSSVSNHVDNITYDRKIVHLDLNTGQYSTTTSTEQVTNVWDTSSWEYSEKSGTALTVNFSEFNQTWNMDGNAINSRSQVLSEYTTWATTQWTQGQVYTFGRDWYETGDYWWAPGPGTEPTEYRQTYAKDSTVRVEYQGILGEESLIAPAGQYLNGPLPTFIPIDYQHYIDSYNLGQTFVPNGTYLIYADRTADIELTVGDSTVYGGGFVYGGVGNSTLSSGHTLVAGTGDQRLEYGQYMVVGDGHNTVIGKTDSSIYVDPNNAGMDLIASSNHNDGAVLDTIYASEGITNWAERYQYAGMLRVSLLEGYRGYFNSIDEARSDFNASVSWTTFDDAVGLGYLSVSQVEALPFLPKLYNMDALASMSASAYYNNHSTPGLVLGATEFAALQPYIDADALQTPRVHFGPGLSLADIQFSWSEAISPINGKLHITLDLQWGQDQGVRILIPGVSDPLNSAVQHFEFANGSVVNLTDLIALAPPKVLNRAPTLSDPVEEQGVAQGQLFSFSVAGLAFVDPDDGDTLSYDAIQANGEPLPDWLSFDTETGIFSGTPGNDDVGALELSVTAIDRFGESVTTSFNMTVVNANDAPVVAMVAADLVCQQAEALSLQIDENLFADIDVGDSLQWSLSLANGDPLPSWLSFDALTRTLLGTPQFKDTGVLSLQVTVTDTSGATSSQTFALTVNETAGLQVTGTTADESLFGGSGSDHIDGGQGADTMSGGEGNDVYVVDNALDGVMEAANEGHDRVESAVSYTLGANLEDLTLTGTAAINGTGNAGNNTLVGNSANNSLNGGAGSDVLIGGAGNDTYRVDVATDIVIENQNEGTDIVSSSVISLTLGANIENMVLLGSAALNGTGNELDNFITGNAGANILVGGLGNDSLYGAGGADTMSGGLGNDSFYVDNTGDVVLESAGEGSDTVISTISYSLGGELENLTLGGTAAINGTGNDLGNVMRGNAASNMLSGGLGNDTLDGSAGADSLLGGLGNDIYIVDNADDQTVEWANEGIDTVRTDLSWTLGANVENLTLTGTLASNATGNAEDNSLLGNGANNTLVGDAGNDILDGGNGSDTMLGGTGNDTYYVNLTTDVVQESLNEGIDTVITTATFTLSANVENLTMTGNGTMNGTGNELNNILRGNWGLNTLTAGAGDDVLDGGAHRDYLYGGTGNDTYIVGLGYGSETVYEDDATAGNTDVLSFMSGIASDQLWFRKLSNDLEVQIIGTSDRVTLTNWYLGNQHHVEQFKTSDGKTLLDSQVQNLVSAMAAFSPPTAGQTTLPVNYANSLSPVIAANWQ